MKTLNEIKNDLLSVNCSMRYEKAMEAEIRDAAMAKIQQIQNAAETDGTEFVASVAKTVAKYEKISEKQAYVLARYAADHGMFDEPTIEEVEAAEIDEEVAEAITEAQGAEIVIVTEGNATAATMDAAIASKIRHAEDAFIIEGSAIAYAHPNVQQAAAIAQAANDSTIARVIVTSTGDIETYYLIF